MPSSIVTISEYTADPSIQVDSNSSVEVRGFYNRDFVAGDGVTPVLGNSSNGEQGPFYTISASVNGNGNLVVTAHDIQATTLSNPTANYFEGLWVNGAFVQFLLPNTNSATGWQIPTVYGPIIAFDEIATYNRARRLVFAPDTYLTADQTIQEIQRLAGNFAYSAVGINGIGSVDVAPALAWLPIFTGVNSPQVNPVGAVYWAVNYPSFEDAVTAMGNSVPVRLIVTEQLSVDDNVTVTPNIQLQFEGNGRLIVAANKTVTIQGPIVATPGQWIFDVSASGAVISFSGNKVLTEVCLEWFGAKGDGVDDDAVVHATFVAAAGRPIRGTPGAIYAISTLISKSTPTALISDAVIGEDVSGAYLPTFKWIGAAGGTMFLQTGQGYLRVQGWGFDLNGLADTAIKEDSPTNEFKTIIDNCEFNQPTTRATTKVIYLSPTASANVENFTLSNTQIGTSPDDTIGVARGTGVYFGPNSNMINMRFEKVWIRRGTYGIYMNSGQLVHVSDSFLMENDTDIYGGGVSKLLLENLRSENSRQFLYFNNVPGTMINCDLTLTKWEVAVPVISLGKDARFTAIGNAFGDGGAGATQKIYEVAGGGASSLVSLNNTYFPQGGTNLGFNQFVDGYISLFDVGFTQQGGITTNLAGLKSTSLISTALVSTPHLVGTGADLVVNPAGGAGTGPTLSALGGDLGGTLTVLTGAVPDANNDICYVVFNTVYASAPRAVNISPANAAAAALSGNTQVFVSATGTAFFTLHSGLTNLTAATTYKWYYTVVQ